VSAVAFAERAAFFPAHDALVVADLHVGRGEASAVSFPVGEREDLLSRLDGLLSRFDPETVVVAGDAVHTFAAVSDRSRETLVALREGCEANGAGLELVAGNHDASLANEWDEPVRDALVLDHGKTAPRTVVCHGHEAPGLDADRYVVGHVHPTIEIEGDRRPCFLRGERTYRGSDLLVLPAFTRLAPGVAVNEMHTDAFNSPLVTDANRLAPVVSDPDGGEPLRFPPLGAFRELL